MAIARSSDLSRSAGELRIAVGRIVRRLRQEWEAGDLTAAELSMLARLEQDGPCGPVALAEDPHVVEEAARLITAEYDALPVIEDEIEAMTSTTLVRGDDDRATLSICHGPPRQRRQAGRVPEADDSCRVTLPVAPVESDAERGRLTQPPFVVAQQGDAVRHDIGQVRCAAHDDELVEPCKKSRLDRPGDERSSSDRHEQLLARLTEPRTLARSQDHSGDRHWGSVPVGVTLSVRGSGPLSIGARARRRRCAWR